MADKLAHDTAPMALDVILDGPPALFDTRRRASVGRLRSAAELDKVADLVQDQTSHGPGRAHAFQLAFARQDNHPHTRRILARTGLSAAPALKLHHHGASTNATP